MSPFTMPWHSAKNIVAFYLDHAVHAVKYSASAGYVIHLTIDSYSK